MPAAFAPLARAVLLMRTFVLLPLVSKSTLMISSRVVARCSSSTMHAMTTRTGGTTSRYSPQIANVPPQGARQRILKTPPGRASAAQSLIVKPLGAYHLPRCSARVQASNTRPRGASMMRVIAMDAGSFTLTFPSL